MKKRTVSIFIVVVVIVCSFLGGYSTAVVSTGKTIQRLEEEALTHYANWFIIGNMDMSQAIMEDDEEKFEKRRDRIYEVLQSSPSIEDEMNLLDSLHDEVVEGLKKESENNQSFGL